LPEGIRNSVHWKNKRGHLLKQSDYKVGKSGYTLKVLRVRSVSYQRTGVRFQYIFVCHLHRYFEDVRSVDIYKSCYIDGTLVADVTEVVMEDETFGT
jgi:hypothetical protein